MLGGFTHWTGGDIELNNGTISSAGLFLARNASGTMRLFQSAGPANPLTFSGTFARQLAGEAVIDVPFGNSQQVTIEGGRLVLPRGGVHAGNFHIDGNATLELGSGHNLGSNSAITGSGLLKASGAIVNVASGPWFDGEVLLVGNSSISFGGARTRIGELTLNDASAARITAGGARALIVTSLDLKPDASLDIADNALIVDYAGPSPIESIRAAISRGYANGAWNGTGLRSAMAAQPGMAVGYAESGDLFTTFPATFAGQPVDDSAVVVRRTLKGDANLDGRVNLADFNRLAVNFGQAGRGWSTGDSNYDGEVNLSDFNALAGNFGREMSP
jgi:hypothetical protein